MDVATLRAQFPVFEEVAYLNAGTCGPLPGQALRAAADVALAAAEGGRSKAYFEGLTEVSTRLRAAYAGVIGAEDPHHVALTTATSDGMAAMLEGLGLQRGDVVLTAPDEHPGLLGPLAALRDARGVEVRTAPFDLLHEGIDGDVTLIACSHVSWITGRFVPAETLGQTDVPVLLDGAQSAGAVPLDVPALGCAFFCAAGQKWLCGPMGTGLLWIDPAWRERLRVPGPTYANLAVPDVGLSAVPHPDARAFDAPALSPELLAAALAAHEVLAAAGWDAVHTAAIEGAGALATALRERGVAVVDRDATTLVTFEVPGAQAFVARAAEAGVTVRSLPATPYVRASFGAWNNGGDVERLLALL